MTKPQHIAVIAIACITLFTACSTTQTKPPVTKAPQGLVIGNPINYYNDSTLLFPVGCDYQPTNDNLNNYAAQHGELRVLPGNATFSVTVNSVSYGSTGKAADVSEYRNTDPDAFDMRNLLFMNKYTHQSYTLSDSSLHVISFEMHKEFIHPYVMYKIVKRDFNRDSLFTSKDVVSLYFSNPDGSNFKQVTPDGEDYNCYFYYPETNSLLLKTFNDSNNDHTISTGDASNFFEVDLKNPAMGKNIFPDSLKAKLQTFI